MNKLLLNKRDTAFFQAVRIILINAVLLASLLLLFTPTEKIDDYRLKFILAGAATGQSDSHLLQYSNFFLGRILQTLTTWFHAIPWYEATQYVALFVSFCVLVYLVKKRKLGTAGNAILLILLVIFGYEAYIKLTFSKTAGIACAAGLFLLFSVLYETHLKKGGLKKNIFKLIVSFCLIIVGALLRYNVWRLILGIGIAYLLYSFVCACIDIKKGDSQIAFKNIIIRFGRTVIVCLVLFCCLYGINKAGTYSFSQNAEWDDYRSWNSLKADLQDYEWPEYEDNKEEYEDLGINETMYQFWSDREYSDPEYLSPDTMRDIINIKGSTSDPRFQKIISFFKEFPNRFFKEICFWAVLPLIVYWFLSKQKYKIAMLILSIAMLMLLNFYQYMTGRYDQHQINVGIWFAFALIYIGCMSEATEFFAARRSAVILSMLYLMGFVCVNYNYLVSNSYYGASSNRNVSMDDTKQFLELASNDTEHLYVASYLETRYGFMGYSVFEQIPAGLYHNIYCVQEYMYPTSRISLDNYGVYNVYREMVDSDVIYYYRSNDVSTGNLKRLVNYIQDLYNSTAESSLVKQFDGFSVYSILSDDFQLDTEKVKDIDPGEEGVISNVALSVTIEPSKSDEPYMVTTKVSGDIYKSDSNSFNQRVYLEICNASGESSYYVVTMYGSDSTNDIMNGAYGKVSGTYKTEAEEWSSEDTSYYIILECDEGMYRIPLEVN